MTAKDYDEQRQFWLAKLEEMASGIKTMNFGHDGPDKLLEDCEKLIAKLKSPDCTEDDIIKAELYLNAEEMEFLRADDAKTRYARGLSLDKVGQYKEAVASYDKAIEINPKNADAYANKGKTLGEDYYITEEDALLAELDEIDKDLAIFDKAIEMNPDDADAYYSKAVALGASTIAPEYFFVASCIWLLQGQKKDPAMETIDKLSHIGMDFIPAKSYAILLLMVFDYADGKIGRDELIDRINIS